MNSTLQIHAPTLVKTDQYWKILSHNWIFQNRRFTAKYAQEYISNTESRLGYKNLRPQSEHKFDGDGK